MRIAFVGDSLTEGWPGAAFFPLLQGRVARHSLVNRGRAGDTVASLLARMRSEGLEPVDVAFIWVGANDAVMGDAAPDGGWSRPERLQRLGAQYEQLLEWAAARASRIVVVLPLVLEAEGSLWEQRAGEVAEAIAGVARSHPPCRVVDLLSAFAAAGAAGGGPFTIDGVHFTGAGAEVVAGAFADVLRELESEGEAPADAGVSEPAGSDSTT